MKANNTPHADFRTRWNNSFWHFCFSKAQVWDWVLVFGICLIGYIGIRLAYPYPVTMTDSFTYLRAAIDEQFSAFRPYGFSEWLRVIHVFSTSIFSIFIVQTLLYALCCTLLILALKRYFPIRPTWLRWTISVFIVASPVAFYMLNAIMSDALFGCMMILMIAMLIVLAHEGSYSALLIYFGAFFVALFTRYSGMFFIAVLIPILFFLPHKPCRYIGIVGTLLISLFFYQNICNNMQEITHRRQFSTGFDGWQWANNGMHVLPFVDEDKAPKKNMQLLHEACLASRDYICQKTDSGHVASAAFLWDKQSPLKQYLFYYMQTRRVSYVEAWAKLGGGIYADYGKWLIKQHPIEFCRYYLVHNTAKVFYPDCLELVNSYSDIPADNREVQKWFGIDAEDIQQHPSHPLYEKYINPILPALELALWIVMFGALLAMLIRWKHWSMTRSQRIVFWVILLLGFVYCGSTAFASPITIRNWFPLQAIKLAFTTVCLYFAIPTTAKNR
jgi:hypothetical protein